MSSYPKKHIRMIARVKPKTIAVAGQIFRTIFARDDEGDLACDVQQMNSPIAVGPIRSKASHFTIVT